MEIRHIEAFLAIADELHFGRAATRLHLTQPALSQQLKRLERELGIELVSRSSRTVHLTSAGQAFRADARRIIEEMGKAADTARDIAAGRAGGINIGFNPRAGLLVMPASLARLHAHYPGIKPRLWAGRSGPQLNALSRGELDVGLLFSGTSGRPLDSRRILPLAVGVLVGQGHAWAGRSSVSVRELAEQPCLIWHREQCPAMYDAITMASERAGTALRVADYVNDSVATEVLVASRMFVGFVSMARPNEPRPMGLKAVPLIDPTPMVDLQVTWRADGANHAVHAFLESVEAARGTMLSMVEGDRPTGPVALPRVAGSLG
jgi:DNA-binding transcriptional LysR family regulator